MRQFEGFKMQILTRFAFINGSVINAKTFKTAYLQINA